MNGKDLLDNILLLHEAAKGQLELLNRILPEVERLLATEKVGNSQQEASQNRRTTLEEVVESLDSLKKTCASSEFLLSTMRNNLRKQVETDDSSGTGHGVITGVNAG